MAESEIDGLAILGRSNDAWPSTPGLVLVHELLLPEVRSRFLETLSERKLWDGGLLCLTPAEWGIWSRTGSSFGIEALSPLWGEPQHSCAVEEPSELRRSRLRQVTGLFLGAFHLALDGDAASLAGVATEIRDRLEQESSPIAFPPRWNAGASAKTIHASVLGALHATLAAEVSPDPGEPTEASLFAVLRPARSAGAVRALMGSLLADLPADFIGDEVLALYLLPGPLGSRLSSNLVAVVSDDAPLDRCAQLHFALGQHLRLLPRREVQAAFGRLGGPVVIPISSLAGILRRRLFATPLRRHAIAMNRQLLLGEDVLSDAFEGPDFSPEDLAFELAVGIEDMQQFWASPGRACDVLDLFYGRLPALIHLARGGSHLAGLAEAQEQLASSVDPAQAFAGREGLKAAWCDPSTADLGRARELLRDRGPMLLRLQEVAVEVLMAAESG
jgi:hypothetical protein